MSFTRRIISLRFQLGTGAFGEDGSNVVDLTGLRCAADISKPGNGTLSSANLRVWGMSLDTMAKLTVLNQLLYSSGRENTLTISAGDETNGLSVCFVGTINEAWADFQSAPDVLFQVTATNGILAALKPVPATSFNGAVDVATVLAGIATQMGLQLENNGVSVVLRNTYLPGTALDQLRTVMRQADIEYVIDDTTLAIWPKGGNRGGQIPLLSPETGMVGYPTFTQNSLYVRTLFNPGIAFGQLLEIKSVVPQATGSNWKAVNLTHNLTTETADGPWFTTVECALPGAPDPLGNA